MTDPLPVGIRPYEPRDRAAVRYLACETANRGSPVEPLFYDREVVADLVTRYYTDDEPASLWIAERDGRVVGYLSGCLDSRRYERLLCWDVAPRAAARAILRGALCRAQTWRLTRALLGTWRRGGLARSIPLDRYPAHLHVNVQAGCRGQGVGERLMARCLEQARAAGVRGLHAAVRADNLPGCRFFERMGFTVFSRQPVVLPAAQTYRVHERILYVQSIEADAL